MRWLSKRHDVKLLPVYRNEFALAEAGDIAADLAARVAPHVHLGPSMIEPAPVGMLRRFHGFKSARSLGPDVLEATAGSDWVWFSYPPAVANRELLDALRRRGARVSWDWDCLSLLSARTTRHHGFTPRAAVAAAATLSCVSYERRYLRRLDVLTAPCLPDARCLQRTTGRNVLLLRAAVDLSCFAEPRGTHAESPTAVFIGSSWGPNVDGIRWVLRNVWPEVSRRMPSARLRIAGRGMTSQLLGETPPGVDIVGEVADVTTELARARVVLSPIFYGSGIPTKLLEAGASAKATLTTRYCDRALGGSGFHVSDDALSWQHALLRLLRDPGAAADLGERGLRAIEQRWSVAAWNDDMERVETAVAS